MSRVEIETIKSKYNILKPELNERGRRLWATTEANSLGHGGVAIVVQATGLSDSTIKAGRRELKNPESERKKSSDKIRKKGGGRKRLQDKDSELLELLDRLVEPTSRGDPMSPLRWTCKSTRRLSRELMTQRHAVSHTKVGKLLIELGYSLQSNRKRMEGSAHPDRNAQFEFINSRVMCFQNRAQPVISVDAKKKELIGHFTNAGREYQPIGKSEETETYDFPSLADGKGIPYGIYDMNKIKAGLVLGQIMIPHSLLYTLSGNGGIRWGEHPTQKLKIY